MSPHRDSPFVKRLRRREQDYYRRIVRPDVLIVLRVDPEVAVQRKTDEDPAFVRARNTEIWELNWEDVDAHLIDGGKSKKEVLSAVKALLWLEL
jgi:thymidylate kinase